MKKTAWIWAFLVCFLSYQGFAQGTGTGENTIPVNTDIVKSISKDYGGSTDLKFYLSKPIRFKDINQKESTDKYKIIDGEVIINTDSPANENVIEFSKNSEGKLAGPPENGGMEIKIYFKDKDKILVFRRNGQQNRYEFFSIMIGNIACRSAFSEPIYLYVSSKISQEQEIEEQIISSNSTFNNNSQLRYDYTDNQFRQDNFAHNASYNNISYNSSSPSRKIMGSGSISSARVIEYVRTKKNLTSRDIAIIEKYFEEAYIEGVNVDIAIAQMLYWTNNLRNNQRVASNNYGGLSPLPQNNFYGSFTSMTIGVRAHIQHLKGYANVRPNQKLVDPRYSLAVERGFTGITFDQVYRSWSANSRYGQEIDNILRDLYR
jgi:hypothetical protein